jgi:hypothetical protein
MSQATATGQTPLRVLTSATSCATRARPVRINKPKGSSGTVQMIKNGSEFVIGISN